MDAELDALQQRKERLMAEIVEIEIEEQRRRGMFDRVPHFSEIEDSGRKLGQFLSRLSQCRMANEVAAEEKPARDCPSCGKSCPVKHVRRRATGLDGPLEFLEPQAHCSVCRRDFFPSA